MVGTVEKPYEPTIVEEKLDKKNEMKARGTLLMSLPNKDQLKFHSYQDAKLLMEAIEKRYVGNKESKKVQRTLLKQQYENFAVTGLETLDQTFDRLQKLISQLEIQEIETISLDDLYNNLKLYEPELTGSSSISQNPQNVAFVSSNSTSSTNEADNTTCGVSTAHTQGNIVNSTSIDNLSDAVICAFLASQPNFPQLAREDLGQIDPDDLEEMDLHWEMAMLTIKARRFIKRTSRKLDINGQENGFDRSKVECFNCHKNRHFVRECRASKNQENRGREYGRKFVPVENPTENALIAQDGIRGYDWSYQAEEEHPTNFALMALTSSESSSNSDYEVDSCSKTCLKVYATLKEQYDSLSSDYKKSQFNLLSYKAGLQSIEERLVHWNYIPPKPDLMYIDEQVESESMDVVSTISSSAVKTVESKVESVDVKNKDGKGRISRKGKIKTGTLDFDDVYFCKELKYNMFSVSQLCDKKNNVLFIATEYLVLSFNFKLLDESQVLLRVPRKDNIYSVDLKSFVPTGGYSVVSKAMRVFNKRTKIVEETLNIRFLENAPNVKGNGPDWLFDIDSLTISMNYVPVVTGFQTNGITGTKDNIVASQAEKKKEPEQEYILIPICTIDPLMSQGPKDSKVDAGKKTTEVDESQVLDNGGQNDKVTRINDTGIFGNAYNDEAVEEEVDMNNVVSSYTIPDDPITKFLKDHPKDQVIGSIETPVQTRQMTKMNEEHGLISSVQKLKRTNHKDFQNCLSACYLSQMEPKKPVQALKIQVRNKKDERGIVIKNKARLVAQGHTQEEGIDYDEVFALVARIEAIRLFLAYASFKDFIVYQIDVNNAFIYEKIEEEALRAWYETLSTYLIDNGFHRGQIDKTLFIKRHKDDILLVQVYVDDIIFRSTKNELSTEFETLMHDKFQMSYMGELFFFLGLQVQQKSDGIFISQDKYVADILKRFGFFTVKTTSTPMDHNKALVKVAEAEDVDMHLHRSMIGSLMYLTASRPDITFVVCACARDSPFDLEAYSDSDYAGASLDRKSTAGGCQFLGKRLISWQYKK
nr:hypothetical protein [Tanacetum cinerariifolium]